MDKSTHFKILLSIGASNLGGAQQVFLNIAEVLKNNGFQVAVALPEGPLLNHIQTHHPDISIYELPNGFWGKVFFISRLQRSQKFDLCCPHLGNASLWFALSSLLVSMKLSCTFHNVIFSEKTHPLKQWILRRLYKFIFWRSQSVVTVSEYLKTDTEKKLGRSFEKFRVIPNGIPRLNHSPKPLYQKLTLGIVGRCTWEKGHLLLIEALSHLKDLELRCLILGDGPDLPKLQEAARQYGVEDTVDFLGWSDQVQKVINESVDIVVVPSLEEAFSLATLEAFSVSTPVIGSRCGGIPALVEHEVNGLLFEKGNAHDLAGKIRQMATSRERVPEMGARGYEKFLTGFTLETHQQLWLEHLKGLGESPRP